MTNALMVLLLMIVSVNFIYYYFRRIRKRYTIIDINVGQYDDASQLDADEILQKWLRFHQQLFEENGETNYRFRILYELNKTQYMTTIDYTYDELVALNDIPTQVELERQDRIRTRIEKRHQEKAEQAKKREQAKQARLEAHDEQVRAAYEAELKARLMAKTVQEQQSKVQKQQAQVQVRPSHDDKPVNIPDVDELILSEYQQNQAQLMDYMQDSLQKKNRHHYVKADDAFTTKGFKWSNQVILRYVDNMDGLRFEEYFGKLLRHFGNFKKVVVTRGSGDYGIDVIAVTHTGKRLGFQLKRYQKDASLGVDVIYATHAGADYYHCDMVYVVTTANHFTKNAETLAERLDVELIRRRRIYPFLKFVKTNTHKS